MGTDIQILPEISHHDEPWRPISTMTPVKIRRDYALFALLADVRNHAGRHVPILQPAMTIMSPEGKPIEIPAWTYDPDDGGHDRLEPITTPRGVPDDASKMWREYVDGWIASGAVIDISWITPEEVLSADWDQDVYAHGLLTEEDYLNLRDHGTVPKLSAMNSGGIGTQSVNEIEYAQGKRGENGTTVAARWKEGKIRDSAGWFLDLAQGLVDRCPPTSKVRFMLLFDS